MMGSSEISERTYLYSCAPELSLYVACGAGGAGDARGGAGGQN